METKEGAHHGDVRMPDKPAPLPEQGLTPSARTTHEAVAVQPAPLPERSPSLEKNAEKAREMTTATVARYSAASVDNKFLKPGEKVQNEDEAKRIGQEAASQPPETIPSEAIEEYSLKARAETRQTAAGWRKDVAKWIRQETVDQPQDPQNVTDALRSLGIDTTKQGKELDDQIKQFSETYIPKTKSEIKKFAEDLAKGCQDADGNIDLTKFDRELQAIGEFLNSFGTKDDINHRVKDYAATYAIRYQAQRDEHVRDAHAEQVANHLMHPLSGKEERSFAKFYEEQHKATELREKVKARLQLAESDPEQTSTIGIAHNEESQAQKQFAYGEITKEEVDQKLAEIRERMKGIARFDTPEELLEALKQLKAKGIFESDDDMMEYYQHEVSHYDVATRHTREHDLPKPYFHLQVTRDQEGLHYHPSTQFTLPENANEARLMQDAVTLAPGFDHLSQHDWLALGVTKENVDTVRAQAREMIDQVWQTRILERPDTTEDEAILEVARLVANPKTREEAEAHMAESTDEQADDQGADPEEELTDEQILNIINAKKGEALTVEERAQIEKDSNELRDQANQGTITAEEFNKRTYEINQRMFKGCLGSPTIDTFRRTLGLLTNDEKRIEELIAREKNNYDQNKAAGRESYFVIIFSKKVNGAGEIKYSWETGVLSNP